MFRDCKSGGYNLEGCHACQPRLSTVILLIAIAYTSAVIQGINIKLSGVEHYICRPKEVRRIQRLRGVKGILDLKSRIATAS